MEPTAPLLSSPDLSYAQELYSSLLACRSQVPLPLESAFCTLSSHVDTLSSLMILISLIEQSPPQTPVKSLLDSQPSSALSLSCPHSTDTLNPSHSTLLCTYVHEKLNAPLKTFLTALKSQSRPNPLLSCLFVCCVQSASNQQTDLSQQITILIKRLSTLTAPASTQPVFSWLFDHQHPFLLDLSSVPNLELEVLSPPEKMHKANRIFHKRMQNVTAFMHTPDTYSSCRKGLARYFGMCFYPCSAEKAQRQALMFRSAETPKQLREVWGLADIPIVASLSHLVFPSIKYNRSLFLHRKTLLFSPVRSTDSDIPVRFLCKVPLVPVSKKAPKQMKRVSKVLIHMHGGGFIAMSSDSHQMYSREWANQIDCAVLSIDYRLAPEHPYPAALEDVYAVYRSVTTSPSLFHNLSPDSIVLAGDSAGGNLTFGLTAQIIKSKDRLPDGIFAQYPVFLMDSSKFNVSKLQSLDDTLLHPLVFQAVLEYYLRPCDEPGKDPLISPALLSDEVLQQFPPVVFTVGDEDPLRDDSVIMTERLSRLEKAVQLKVYKHMAHGYMNMHISGCPKHIRLIVAQSVEYLTGLFSLGMTALEQ